MVELKPGTPADYGYARHVHHTAYRDMVIQQFGQWDESVQDRFFDRSWNSGRYDIVLFDGKPCGYCLIEPRADCLQLVELAIDVADQGRGVGSLTLAKFLDLAREKRKVAQLNVMKTNTRAKALYEKLGFQTFAENEFQFLMRHASL